MAGELQVELRETRGRSSAKRLRDSGVIPAVLYGHGQENLALSVPAGPLHAMVKQGSRIVMLAGAVDESAFIREVQWNTWGTHLLHVDFNRVSADEKLEVAVVIELRGEAPGAKAGGVVSQSIHEIHLECPAGNIPDRLRVNINSLELDASITIADLQLPEGATVIGDQSTVVVHCAEPVAELEELEVGEAATEEPEVLGRKEEETEESKEK
jgi:large subunit ribosomal protein L25